MTESGLMLDTGAFVVGLERAAGIDAVVTGKPSPEFFFLCVDMLGEKQTMRFLDPNRARLLEYDLSRAITRVGFLILLTIALLYAGIVPYQPLQSTGAPWHDGSWLVGLGGRA